MAQVRIAQLDEYVGVSPIDRRSLMRWLREGLLEPAQIASNHVYGFDALATDLALAAEEMERAMIALGRIDLAVLGLGPNGHVGFNEPGSAFDSLCRVVDLTPESIVSNARYWGGPDLVPRQAFTLGLGTLSKAHETLLLVSGQGKAKVLEATLYGPISPAAPATYLRSLSNVTVIADKNACP
jgi:glucosamine-6-phosphate deaminase